jgi:arginine-tRNA-protein transferase
MDAAPPHNHSHFPAIPPPRAVPLTVLPPHPCSYLPPRVSQSRAFMADRIDPEIYHDFMDAGFRRSGRLVYQPICSGCRECRPIRVPVEGFTPSKSQRRTWRRNLDLVVTVDVPTATDEKFDLYADYVERWHGRPEEAEPEAFVAFLYDTPVDTLEFTYRDAGGKLLGVGICDICRRSLSSVYFYFNPAEAPRSLGTFSTLWEIEFARQRSVPHYYIGYWIDGCSTMHYKCAFRPHELLHPDGLWRENSSPPVG